MSASSSSGGQPRFATVVIVGGGCYGSYYVRQLRRGMRAGAIRCEAVVVVDRDAECRVAREEALAGDSLVRLECADWREFFAWWLATPRAPGVDDAIVPSPLMPHLLRDWLIDAARERWPGRGVRVAPLRSTPPLPWERSAPDGTHYLSFATWICPINCTEPERCPHTRGPRDWSMGPALGEYARKEAEAGRSVTGPFLFHCLHRAYGVGMIEVREVLAADEVIREAGEAGPVDALVGTVSHCHGAVSRVVVDAPERREALN